MPGIIVENVALPAELSDLVAPMSAAGKKVAPGPRIEALEKLAEIVSRPDFKSFEHSVITDLLPVVLARLDDKPKVIEAAEVVGKLIMEKTAIQGFLYTLPVLFTQMEIESKWRAKVGAMKLLSIFMDRVFAEDRALLSACLPELVPVLGSMLHDTKPEVCDQAEASLTTAMRGITNRDLEPFVDALIAALKDREQTEETVQKLGGIVFVQTVEGSALAVVIPLMLAGFRQPKAMIKRMCARIVSNMSKLVEDPLEAKPFLGELIPSLFDAIDTIADPEARDVATKTHAALVTMETAGNDMMEAKRFRQPAEIAKFILSGTPASNKNEAMVNYVAGMSAALIRSNATDVSEWKDELEPYLSLVGAAGFSEQLFEEAKKVMASGAENIDEDDSEGQVVADCEFTLAYGTKILLHNARIKLKKGMKYGLVGQNDCGKTTLMRAIAEGSIDGWPDSHEIRPVFVETDIQGELSHLTCVNYILEYPAIKDLGATEKDVRTVLLNVGFTQGKTAGAGGDCDDPISSLSGGWRMKLALARAMLQKADLLLLDEPTNHLDVKNVKWVESYINSLKDTTCIMVSHDSGLLDKCCTHMIQIDRLKLNTYKGNLSDFVKGHPEAQSYFEFKASKFTFTFPQPSFLEGVKSRGKALLKMDGVTFTYPGNKTPTISDVTVRASMSSRVACVGVNGAGKSTLVKNLIGVLEPQQGVVWKYPNSRIGYIAQHAFHHIEKHVDKTPNEYIRWRYQFGDDREGLDQANMKLSDAEEAELKKPVEFTWKDEKGNTKKEKRVISRLTGTRRPDPNKKKVLQYEVSWAGKSQEANSWYRPTTLSSSPRSTRR
jgi:elongation factor 3